MENTWTIIAIGYSALFLMQTVLWLIQLKTKDASTADVGWTIGMSLLVGWYTLNLPGYAPRKLIVFSLILLWTVRLSYYLISRIMKDGKEDSRYAQFREEWKDTANQNFFLIYQMQPVFNVLLSVPFFIIMSNTSPRLTLLELLACLLWVIGLAGESLADQQLSNFKNNKANKGRICQDGLWNYSRHPNFFFEWLMWVSYFVFALSSPNGLWAIISPLVMLYLLLKVTGIPLMEERALRRKGDAFREYMRTTSFFVPLPKRV